MRNQSWVKIVWNCFLVADTAANQILTFIIAVTKLYVPAITLSSQDNVKLLK